MSYKSGVVTTHDWPSSYEVWLASVNMLVDTVFRMSIESKIRSIIRSATFVFVAWWLSFILCIKDLTVVLLLREYAGLTEIWTKNKGRSRFSSRSVHISRYFRSVGCTVETAFEIWWHTATLTEGFPCFSLSCKGNARVKQDKRLGTASTLPNLLFVMFLLFLLFSC
jgi:hypothetical protein